jgi:hypothetical protein
MNVQTALRNALREFLDGDRVVRWGLVPSRDLDYSIRCNRATKFTLCQHSTSGHEVCDVLRATGMAWELKLTLIRIRP